LVLPTGKGITDLALQDVPMPGVGENEVLIKFQAVSLNYRDLKIAQVKNSLCSEPDKN
jgi:NADPH:quinone reductase-like Zn-dependent oxidoreductase